MDEVISKIKEIAEKHGYNFSYGTNLGGYSIFLTGGKLPENNKTYIGNEDFNGVGYGGEGLESYKMR